MFENFDWLQAMRTSPVMVVILGCSVITFGYAFERIIYYWKRRQDPTGLMHKVAEQVKAGSVREAVWTCNAVKHPVGAAAAQVLQTAHMPFDHQEERLQITLSEQRMLLERNLGVLGTMGNTAPLIGLLGTVWGIMRAFHDMARTGSAGPSVVAAGVAEALFTTAAGLMVAVPAVLLYNHFVRRMGVMLTTAENQARSLRLTLDERASTGSQTSRAA